MTEEERKARWRAYSKEWRANNKEKKKAQRQRQRFRQYDLTEETWNAMFDAQGRACAICSSDQPKSKSGWHTDHCHTTGVVRGILCRGCNLMLGHAADDTETLSKAILYLKK